MGEFADFDAARRERARGREPITFRVGGEDFECLAVAPAGPVLDFAAAGNTPVAGRRFLLALLRDDDAEGDVGSSRDRFIELMYRHDDPIDGDAIIEILQWISEVYAGRPTQRSSDSSDGPPLDGPSSNVRSLTEVASTG